MTWSNYAFSLTIVYADAKAAYFNALRAEVPELMRIATGREARPPELDTFAAAFVVAGEDQEMVADQDGFCEETATTERSPPEKTISPHFLDLIIQ
jgi:hypothetical protein